MVKTNRTTLEFYCQEKEAQKGKAICHLHNILEAGVLYCSCPTHRFTRRALCFSKRSHNCGWLREAP